MDLATSRARSLVAASDFVLDRVRGRSLTLVLPLLPGLAMLAIFFMLPLSAMLLLGVLTGSPLAGEPVALTLQHYHQALFDSFYLRNLYVTFKLGFVTTLLTLILGYPLAYQLARIRRPRVKTLWLVLILSPMLVGLVNRTYAWMAILSDNGLINSLLRSAGITQGTVPLMYNELGVIIALVHIFLPFMVLTVSGVIATVDPALEEAARNLGASKWRAFVHVTLPLSIPGVVAGSLLVFSLAISSYVTPILMGGFRVITLPIQIYEQVAALFNFPLAAAMGGVLLAISLVIVATYFRVMKQTGGPVGA
jgi:putative spermidine/putrescine transport system permease protein